VPSWPIYIATATFAPLFMRAFGSEYRSGQHAVLILSLAALVFVTTGNNKVVLLMGGKSGWNLSITAASLALNVGANLLLIPRYGGSGAAVAFASSIVFDNVATTAVVALRLGLYPFGREQALIALASVLCYGVVGVTARIWLGSSLPAFLSFAAIGTAGYAAFVWRFRRPLQLDVLFAAARGRRRAAPVRVEEEPGGRPFGSG